jgi:hypothetical protein
MASAMRFRADRLSLFMTPTMPAIPHIYYYLSFWNCSTRQASSICNSGLTAEALQNLSTIESNLTDFRVNISDFAETAQSNGAGMLPDNQ